MANKLIITLFSKLLEKYEHDKGITTDTKNKRLLGIKINSMKKIIKVITEYPEEIKLGDDLTGIPGIGKGTQNKIQEILTTGKLPELEGFSPHNKVNEKDKLLKITGIGPSKAQNLLQHNITFDQLDKALKKRKLDIEDIPEDSILAELTHHQLIGLKYFDDIESRIPYTEIQELEKAMTQIIHQIDSKLEITICGSYRRQSPDSGDIDMLLLHPSIKTLEELKSSQTSFLEMVVSQLTENNLLVDDLTKKGKTKYMGLIKLSNKHKARRIDIRFIPYLSKGAAQLYFTGSGNFNKVMRSQALKKGYTINEYGIYRANKKGRKVEKGDLIPTQTERDIFKVVEMDYLEPQDRK